MGYTIAPGDDISILWAVIHSIYCRMNYLDTEVLDSYESRGAPVCVYLYMYVYRDTSASHAGPFLGGVAVARVGSDKPKYCTGVGTEYEGLVRACSGPSTVNKMHGRVAELR